MERRSDIQSAHYSLDQLHKLAGRIHRLRIKHAILDAVLVGFSLCASLYLRIGFHDSVAIWPVFIRWIPIVIGIRMVLFALLGVYDIIWRYISFRDSIRLARDILFSSVLILATSYMVELGRLPRAVFLIDTVLLGILLAGARFARRFIYEYSTSREIRKEGRRTLIYGAGRNGCTIAKRLNSDSFLGFHLIGFIDDDPQKVSRIIDGLKVLGDKTDLGTLLDSWRIQEVIVAIKQPSGLLLREIVHACRIRNVRPKLIASAGDFTKGRVDTVKEIGLSDLLNRPSRTPSLTSLREIIRGKRVLVTGAGGSIGSELARQIFALDPSSLLLLDHSEQNLYHIDQELRVSQSEVGQVVPLLTDLKDKTTLQNLFQLHAPDVVFHAAAYKHVHLVEENLHSAVLNNVLGMQNILECSEAHNVGTFVLISSDKAVNPVGIMGATKRVCELMVIASGRRLNQNYSAVRFGNVLGSSGSLIPLLKDQIKAGGPVTVTHKDMTRYFMLIPEAVALVLRSAYLAKPGDIMLLKMGEPVKVIDIVQSMISLMGKTAEEIPIVFTGMRPGEKLSEELYYSGDEINTEDPDILVLPRPDETATPFSSDFFRDEVSQLIESARMGSKETLFLLKSLIKPTPTSSTFHPIKEHGPVIERNDLLH